jgi:site-specific recombinase XerD
MPPALTDWVDKWVKPHRIKGPLFTNPRGRTAEKRWITDSLEDTWNTAAESVGVKINLYNGTKHTCATEILQRAPKHVVQALLGHADIRSVDNYGRVNTTTLADVIRKPQVIPISGKKSAS